MAFQNSIVAGTALVRQAINSPNYVTGVSGWSINKDGTAEFLDLSVRGEFSTGAPGTARVRITDTPVPRIEFYSNDPSETVPGIVGSRSDAGTGNKSITVIQGNNDGFGHVQITFISPQSGIDGVIVVDTSVGSPREAEFSIGPFVYIASQKTTGLSLSTTNHPLGLGLNSGLNLAFDRQGLQARNNGVAATLFVNDFGGGIVVGSVGNNVDFNGTINVDGAADFNSTTNFDGAATFNAVINANAAVDFNSTLNVDGGVTASKLRAANATDGTARTTASTTFVTLGTANITIPYPASGAVTIAVGGRLTNNTANRGVMSFEIRDTDATGTVRTAASDTRGLISESTPNTQGGWSQVITGLPTTGNLFVRPMFRSNNAANTATFDNISISVIPSA